ncbi:MAG: SUMF1/EgtB/PvdO family nonheme iron enzyme [Bdellovibrionota bacterium]
MFSKVSLLVAVLLASTALSYASQSQKGPNCERALVKTQEVLNLYKRLALSRGVSEQDFNRVVNPENFEIAILEKGTYKVAESEVDLVEIEGAPPPEKFRDAILTHSIEVALWPETQLQWFSVTGENPSRFRYFSAKNRDGNDGDQIIVDGKHHLANHPVEQVTWWSVIEYANRKSKLMGLKPAYDTSGIQFSGRFEEGSLYAVSGAENLKINAPNGDIYRAEGFRLPTVMEWEVFARAGAETGYFPFEIPLEFLSKKHSDHSAKMYKIMHVLDKHAWFSHNTHTTRAVGQKLANALGLRDVLGNVFEMLWDAHEGKSYPEDILLADYAGPPPNHSDPIWAMRGGSYHHHFDRLTVNQSSWTWQQQFPWVGFRLVRTIDPTM